MVQNAVQVEHLAKSYGDVTALRDVSFELKQGEIFGLVGPNGAGKTTTLQILSTLINAGGGTVSVSDHDVQTEPNEVRASIRYLPEDAGTYDNFSGRQYLKFIAGFFSDSPEEMVERGVEIADLGDRIDDKTSEYSKGMLRKVLIASALMTEPELAILDEPTSGLDVQNSREVRDIIKAFPRGERSVVLSSHNMLEVEYLCDRVALLNDGVIVGVGTPRELQDDYNAENLEDAFVAAISGGVR